MASIDSQASSISINDIIEIHDLAFEVLDQVYNSEFKKSRDFQILYSQMQDNMIEYRFLTLAGMKEKWTQIWFKFIPLNILYLLISIKIHF